MLLCFLLNRPSPFCHRRIYSGDPWFITAGAGTRGKIGPRNKCEDDKKEEARLLFQSRTNGLQVQTLLKVKLTKRNLTYKQLSDKMVEIGMQESEPNIRNKLSRGTFSAVFLIQCLTAMGAKSLEL